MIRVRTFQSTTFQPRFILSEWGIICSVLKGSEKSKKSKKKKKEKERLVLKMRRQGGERENSYDSMERLVYKKRQNGDVVIVVAVVMGSMDK